MVEATKEGVKDVVASTLTDYGHLGEGVDQGHL